MDFSASEFTTVLNRSQIDGMRSRDTSHGNNIYERWPDEAATGSIQSNLKIKFQIPSRFGVALTNARITLLPKPTVHRNIFGLLSVNDLLLYTRHDDGAAIHQMEWKGVQRCVCKCVMFCYRLSFPVAVVYQKEKKFICHF